MIAFFLDNIHQLPTFLLLIGIVMPIVVIAKGADLLVDKAVTLSRHWNVSPTFIGATFLSLGTTLPEAVISVAASMKGAPDIALGNAVGSIICNTGLILGMATLLSPLPLKQQIVNRQGWFQVVSGYLLIIACIPFFSWQKMFTDGGMLPRFMGILFLMLLIFYLWFSIHWARNELCQDQSGDALLGTGDISGFKSLMELFLGVGLVVGASQLLIPMVSETALRLRISQGIVSATIVAFGTSLPELVTAVTAVRKGFGELAVGNIIGANILNVLFVVGASASVTTQGLFAPPHFYTILFPSMLLMLTIFGLAIAFSGTRLKRSYGLALLGTYQLTVYVSYI
jgi:cation:H+ antiporter